MQAYEEVPPPPYPGAAAAGHTVPTMIASKGDYKGVPVYEIASSNTPIYNQTTYQQGPVMGEPPRMIPGHAVHVGRRPLHCYCPQCHQQIVTYINHDSGVFAWLMCLLLTVVGCVPCCIIPFCAKSCQDVTHTCPQCSAVVGRYKVL